MWRKRLACVLLWRDACATLKTLKNGVMLAVDGQDVQPLLSRRSHHNLSGHDEDFLARDGQVFACPDRAQGRTQTACADDCDKDHLRFGKSGDLTQATLTRKDSRFV